MRHALAAALRRAASALEPTGDWRLTTAAANSESGREREMQTRVCVLKREGGRGEGGAAGSARRLASICCLCPFSPPDRRATALTTLPPSPPHHTTDAVPFARPAPSSAGADPPPPAKKGRADAPPGAPAPKPSRPPAATRFVALQLFYCGWHYRGFTSAGTADNDGTVEVGRWWECW